MTEYALPLAYALFIWWFATGAIFFLNSLSRTSIRWSMLAATVVLVLAFWGLVQTANDTGVAAAYISFTCGLVVWGWQTMSYYMGFITGPREQACPAGARGGKRFLYGLAASLYHELVVLATAVGLVILTWDAPNQVGTWTFLALWGMHISAKLNIFLGVRNLNEEFLPAHLSYLQTFFRRRAMNPLFPFSVVIGALLTALCIDTAVAVEASDFTTAGYMLLATLVGLAVLEHGFLVLPIPAAILWRWSLGPRDSASSEDSAHSTPSSSTRQRHLSTTPDDRPLSS